MSEFTTSHPGEMLLGMLIWISLMVAGCGVVGIVLELMRGVKFRPRAILVALVGFVGLAWGYALMIEYFYN